MDINRMKAFDGETNIVKFDDFDNLEYRKGSNEFGGLLTRLLEYLRYIRSEEKILTFNLIDFEKESHITKTELESLIKAKEDGKKLYEFEIVIDGNNVTFSKFDSGKTRPFESFNAIRTEYEKYGVENYYKYKGHEYINPHLSDIKLVMDRLEKNGIVDFSNVLDLAAGTGEITNILYKYGYDNIEGADLYMCNEYEKNTNKSCNKLSFSDIQKGALGGKMYSTIVCSYAMHLADKSILYQLLWQLSLVSKQLVIISPTSKPIVSEDSWELVDSYKIGKANLRVFNSNN